VVLPVPAPPSPITSGAPSAIHLNAASNVVMSAALGEPAVGPGSPDPVRPGPSAAFVAWMIWTVAHIFFLIGLRNRMMVALHWLWAYFTFQRGARLITGPPP
jgi:hypothetical protein